MADHFGSLAMSCRLLKPPVGLCLCRSALLTLPQFTLGGGHYPPTVHHAGALTMPQFTLGGGTHPPTVHHVGALVMPQFTLGGGRTLLALQGRYPGFDVPTPNALIRNPPEARASASPSQHSAARRYVPSLQLPAS